MHLAPPPFDLHAAWDYAIATVQRIVAIFGDPVAIRDQAFLPRSDIRLMLEWLRPLEALLRRLLLLKAMRSAPPPQRPRAPRDSARFVALRAIPRRRGFRVLPCARRASGVRTLRRRLDPEALIASGPMARRFNALVCALVRPAPLVARLARRLYARDARALALARAGRGDRRNADALGAAAAVAVEFALADFLGSLAERAVALDSS